MEVRARDLSGQVFGLLTVIKRHEKSRNVIWECQCACGKVLRVTPKSLLQGLKEGCGRCCSKKEEDITGRVFGYLTAVEKESRAKWFCECVCGKRLLLHRQQLLKQHAKGCEDCSPPINKKGATGGIRKNLVGQKFGLFTVVSVLENRAALTWNVVCACGRHRTVVNHVLVAGRFGGTGCNICVPNPQTPKQIQEIEAKRNQQRDKRANWLAQGLCRHCGSPREPRALPDGTVTTFSLCQYCRAKKNITSEKPEPKEPNKTGPSAGYRGNADDRFWKHVDKSKECWTWTGGLGEGGYGIFWMGGSSVAAHRASYMLNIGPIPEDKPQINHKCANRNCVRPDHLYAGTHQENMKDAIAHGSTPKLEDHSSSKLTNDQVLKILADPREYREIAKDFGVSPPLISLIKKRTIWRHLEAPVVVNNRSRKKLTREQVLRIRADNRPSKILAAEIGVSPATVNGVRSGAYWKDVV